MAASTHLGNSDLLPLLIPHDWHSFFLGMSAGFLVVAAEMLLAGAARWLLRRLGG